MLLRQMVEKAFRVLVCRLSQDMLRHLPQAWDWQSDHLVIRKALCSSDEFVSHISPEGHKVRLLLNIW